MNHIQAMKDLLAVLEKMNFEGWILDAFEQQIYTAIDKLHEAIKAADGIKEQL